MCNFILPWIYQENGWSHSEVKLKMVGPIDLSIPTISNDKIEAACRAGAY